MTVSDLLTAIRASYVEVLARAAAESTAHVEPAFRRSDGTLATDGALNLPCRADLIPKQGGPTVSVDSQNRLAFEPLSFALGATSVTLNSFVWDNVHIEIAGPSETPETMKAWFLDWFDGDDDRAAMADGLFGVVHFMSDPTRAGTTWSAVLDLGSAPAHAFEELLWLLSDAGAEQIRVS